MAYTRQQTLERLHERLRTTGYILGLACGAGLHARYASKGGADIILALNSGHFRQMGIGSLAGFLPYANCNQMVMLFAGREILPAVKDLPVIFGLCATDPTITLADYLDEIHARGFSGINNYPSVGLIDGRFREALEEIGISFEKEVEAVRLAHEKDMFSLAYVFDAGQARRMLGAGADVICAHLGLTKGGALGARNSLSLENAAAIARDIFAVCDELRPQVIKLVYGGPVNTPLDVQYIYENTSTQGYIGGSSLDRIPTEGAIIAATREFRVSGRFERDTQLTEKLSRLVKRYDYVALVKEYVAANYMNALSFADVAKTVHVSRSHLSALFKKEVGCTFPEYLTQFRINKAMSIIRHESIPLADVALLSGYSDYAHFSKVFKRRTGLSPREFSKTYKKT